jgi:soluble lytic murein transglycosylase-like protein
VFARRQLAAAACAAGLATSSVAGAIAAPTEDARERGTSAKIAIVERPAKRFERSIERHLEREARRDRAQAGAGAQGQSPESLGVSQSTLDAIAACESGGDPAAVNGAGYYGKYQFDVGTWQSVGGSGNPAEASEAEQDYRAALLYSRAGSSPWPICGA